MNTLVGELWWLQGGVEGMAPHYQSLPLEMGSVYLAESPLRALSWRGNMGKCAGKRAAV